MKNSNQKTRFRRGLEDYFKMTALAIKGDPSFYSWGFRRLQENKEHLDYLLGFTTGGIIPIVGISTGVGVGYIASKVIEYFN